MGRPPKPTERKRATGNPGGRPLPAPLALLPAPIQVPAPPRPLSTHGRDLWERIWSGAHGWVSDRTDIDLALLVCEQVDERSVLRHRVFTENHWRDRSALRALEDSIAKNLSALGMTPTDRARLGLAEVSAASQLERLRRERNL